MEAMLAT